MKNDRHSGRFYVKTHTRCSGGSGASYPSLSGTRARRAQRHPQLNLAKQERRRCSQQNRLLGCVLFLLSGAQAVGQQGASAARHRWLSTLSSRGTRPPKGKRTARPKQEHTPRATPPRKHTATQKNRARNNGAWGALPPHPLPWGRTWSNMKYEQIEPARHEDKEQCDQQKRVRL